VYLNPFEQMAKEGNASLFTEILEIFWSSWFSEQLCNQDYSTFKWQGQVITNRIWYKQANTRISNFDIRPTNKDIQITFLCLHLHDKRNEIR
jgi:hypothetical protein